VLTRTEGIVLTSQKHGEADLIVTYLTRDRGIIKAFAKSPRKIKSRFGSSLEPLTYVRISLIGKEQSIPKITQSDIIKPFRALRENYHDLVNISRLIRLMLFLTPEDTHNKRLFNFFLSTLNLIESSAEDQRQTLYLIALIRLLAMIGYAPRLNKCGRCGRSGINFYPQAGTILCNKCIDGHQMGKPFVRVNSDIINFYSHCIEWPVERLSRLKPRRDLLSTLFTIMDKHISQNLGIRT
jgi:DNA repair protein RecO (recombination protein O)